ncbi:hypothetical protein IGI04_031003, partial [Brassica rapa subsp. trilocularis]
AIHVDNHVINLRAEKPPRVQPQTRNKEVVSPLHATATRYQTATCSSYAKSWEKTKGVIMEAWDEEDKDAYGWIKKDSTTWIGDNRFY